MADVNVVRSSYMTCDVGRLFNCTIANGKLSTYSGLLLLNMNKLVWM